MTDRSDDRWPVTIRVGGECSLSAARVVAAVCDFSEQRAAIFPAVSVARLKVHALGETSADATEGTRAGPIVNWERCDYDWSQPGIVRATVTDSNVYVVGPSSWELTATDRSGGGSDVEMTWVRTFRSGPRGRFFATVYRRAGQRLFANYARDILANLERLHVG